MQIGPKISIPFRSEIPVSKIELERTIWKIYMKSVLKIWNQGSSRLERIQMKVEIDSVVSTWATTCNIWPILQNDKRKSRERTQRGIKKY